VGLSLAACSNSAGSASLLPEVVDGGGVDGGMDTGAPAPDGSGATPDTIAPVDVTILPGTCDLLSNLGCKDTESCAPQESAPPKCIAAGKAIVGAGCKYVDDCVPQALCVNSASGGVCRGRCDTSLDPIAACKGDGGCSPLSGAAAASAHLGVCTPIVKCNFLTSEGCAPNEQCYPSQKAAGGSVCTKPGAVPLGGACKAANDCIKGHVCASVTGKPNACVQVCDVTYQNMAFACANGKTCNKALVPTPSGATQESPDNMGHCAL